jgi:hypothetical protein
MAVVDVGDSFLEPPTADQPGTVSKFYLPDQIHPGRYVWVLNPQLIAWQHMQI